MATREAESHTLVVGGGIGGLATAIALGREGRKVTVLERSTYADESGAGIQLGPNATRALRALGVLEAIEQDCFKPEAIWIFDGRSGRRLATVPLGTSADQRHGAPYLTVHRADLHARLLAACQGLGSVALTPGVNVTSVEQSGGVVVATTLDGETFRGSSLIAADGLWSTLRSLVAPGVVPRFAGATAWRTLLSRHALPSPFDAPVVGLWLGPRAHLVHYPVRGGKDLNLVAVVESGETGRGWSEPADASALLANFTRWSKDPKSLLELASAWRGWSLYSLSPLRRWSLANIALLGDAAHPTLPFFAQGAALALEDAVTVRDCLERENDPAAAFNRYQMLRQQRTRRVQRRSQRLGTYYQLGGPARLVRNALLAQRRPDALLRSLDWLYGSTD